VPLSQSIAGKLGLHKNHMGTSAGRFGQHPRMATKVQPQTETVANNAQLPSPSIFCKVASQTTPCRASPSRLANRVSPPLLPSCLRAATAHGHIGGWTAQFCRATGWWASCCITRVMKNAPSRQPSLESQHCCHRQKHTTLRDPRGNQRKRNREGA